MICDNCTEYEMREDLLKKEIGDIRAICVAHVNTIQRQHIEYGAQITNLICDIGKLKKTLIDIGNYIDSPSAYNSDINDIIKAALKELEEK